MYANLLSKIITEFTAILVRAMWLGNISGIRNIPAHPCIIIANHESYLDFLLIGYSLNRKAKFPFTFWAKSKVLHHSLWRIYSDIFTTIEVGTNGDINNLFQNSKIAMQSGNYICIFPEGTRSRTGDLQYFRHGYLKLAANAGVEVVPAFLEHTHAAWPPGKRLPRRKKCNITFLPAITVSRAINKSGIEEINQSIMNMYRGLKKS